ncbi:hypothetical protein BLNAU_23738 [Blattamonas nauphoetae]|uniref:Uncharacterized protein n=1 Tax=Blattamonas nauphoetae TaxID=2049346 RepID=A0ABQ9WQD3_9EUKA|nr:hypothetical protein BLNAU_23738 [Blattamonas nauphoetae]
MLSTLRCLTMTLRKCVNRISKMKEMEREEADEDEEAAGIMSLDPLTDGISVFLPCVEDMAKMIKRLLHLSLDTCIVFSYNFEQSAPSVEVSNDRVLQIDTTTHSRPAQWHEMFANGDEAKTTITEIGEGVNIEKT